MRQRIFSWSTHFLRDFADNIGDIHTNHPHTPTPITALYEEAV
jgi:hypothetical protein